MKTEYQYPKKFRSKITNSIVEFVSLTTGIILVKGESIYSEAIGSTIHNFIPHTHTGTWEEVIAWEFFNSSELVALKQQVAEIQDAITRMEQEPKPEYVYPMWFKAIEFPGLIVKFTNLQNGIVVSEGCNYKLGESSTFTPHNRSLTWTQIDEPIPEVKQWEPQGGEWYVSLTGKVNQDITGNNEREFGTEYPTKDQAEWACRQMRSFNRLLCYIAGHTEGIPEDVKIYVDSYGVLRITHHSPTNIAQNLFEKLRSGEVIL